MDIVKVFGSNLKKYRTALGISQEAFADRCGMHRTYISAIECYRRSISLENIQRIAEALGIETYQLFIENKEDITMTNEIREFRDGIFALRTRRFGTVAELMTPATCSSRVKSSVIVSPKRNFDSSSTAWGITLNSLPKTVTLEGLSRLGQTLSYRPVSLALDTESTLVAGS